MMSVYVIDSEVGRPLQENAGLGKVDQRSPETSLVNSPYLDGKPKRPGEGSGPLQGHSKQCSQKPEHAGVEDRSSPFSLCSVFLTDQFSLVPPH